MELARPGARRRALDVGDDLGRGAAGVRLGKGGGGDADLLVGLGEERLDGGRVRRGGAEGALLGGPPRLGVRGCGHGLGAFAGHGSWGGEDICGWVLDVGGVGYLVMRLLATARFVLVVTGEMAVGGARLP